MSSLDQAAKELTEIYDDYFRMSQDLQADGHRILDDERQDQTARRNLVRVTWPMLEAYSSSLRAMCSLFQRHCQIRLTRKQVQLLEDESQLGSAERLKQTLKLAFRLHEIDPPRFGDTNWSNVHIAIGVRDRITHPKRASDLEIPDEEWEEAHDGLAWAIRCFTSFFDEVNKKYGSAA